MTLPRLWNLVRRDFRPSHAYEGSEEGEVVWLEMAKTQDSCRQICHPAISCVSCPSSETVFVGGAFAMLLLPRVFGMRHHSLQGCVECEVEVVFELES